MKILLTGATGWVGRHLGLELVRKGHELVCLVRDPASAEMNCPFPAQWVQWASTDASIDEAAFQGVDAVIHLLGEPVAGARWTEKIKKRIYSSRIDSTRVLAEAVKKHRIAHFISASAIGYYGDRKDERLTEDSTPGADFLAKVCTDWERELFAASSQSRCVAVRIGVVLGRDGGALEKMLPPFLMGLGGPIGSGRQWMSWIHLSDLVRLFIAALEDGKFRGSLNATSPNPVRQSDFARELGRQVKRPAMVPAPALALKVAFGEMASVLLASTRALPDRAKELGFTFEFAELNDALGNLLASEAKGENEFNSQQFIARPMDELFAFFSDEKNLEKITPQFLNFKVLAKNTAQIEEGTLIDYQLKLHGVPFRWKTKILDWNPPKSFVDVQLKGPYQLWHHTHTFEPLAGGTLMSDRVRYRLPLGGLGELVAGKKVDNDVKTIFGYRRKVIASEFPIVKAQ